MKTDWRGGLDAKEQQGEREGVRNIRGYRGVREFGLGNEKGTRGWDGSHKMKVGAGKGNKNGSQENTLPNSSPIL